MGESDNVGATGTSSDGVTSAPRSIESNRESNIFVSTFRSIFGYRKTTLTLLVITVMIVTVILSSLDNCLKFGIDLPTAKHEEEILFKSWLDLQLISNKKHTYGSKANDEVHDYLENKIVSVIGNISYIEYDNDLNYTNNIIFANDYLDYTAVSYYESNNLLVRINGTNPKLPALLLSAHYDSVPTSYGVTDDGMGIASMLGVLYHYVNSSQPARTIVFNFNNNEEFGLYGANSFLNHPWFAKLGYFLNLEGTGAGGKAILFRGTDYGIINHFKSVRYPYGTSIFQQGFNNRMIHSETDYKVYFEQGGLRGLDLAFYKPRDLYHTDGDNLANINIKSLWHMLSNSLDFVDAFVADKVDLDDTTEDDPELAIYTSFFNHFFTLPISKLILFNSISLAIFPLITIFLLVVVFHYKKNWQLNSINILKFPISLGLSILLLNFVSKTFSKLNQFLPNSSFNMIFITLFSMFIFLNYVILNLINLIFKNYQVTNHDEKLIVMLEISMIYWAALLWSTIKLGYNKIGDDHTGEYPILIVFLLQAIAVIFGLIGWSFRPARRDSQDDGSEEAEPLLRNNEDDYGSREDVDDTRSDATSTISDINDGKFAQFIKTYSYDWSLQFLIIVPISSYIIYNSGFLILDGISKSIQESMIAEKMIYGIIELFVIAWALPYLPFVFKLNKLIILSIILIIFSGIIRIGITDSFDSSNPLKLRFVQTIDLDKSVNDTIVEVYGRSNTPMEKILQDLPSVKLGKKLSCSKIADGMEQCNYSSTLIPEFLPGKSFEDYLKIDIIKNSSNSGSYGLLMGEIQINVPKNRYCMLNFENQQDLVSNDYYKDRPVKTVIVYRDLPKNSIAIDIKGIPEGFSTDKNGNYIFKKLNGINEFQLNKLDWDIPYHIGFQWVPNILDAKDAKDAQDQDYQNQLGISIKCHWTDLAPISVGNQVYDPIPVYSELLHYSPNYVSWANKEKGLVSITKHIKV